MPMINEKETTMASNEEIVRNLYEVPGDDECSK